MRLLTILAVLLFCAQGYAQEPLAFRHFTTQNGLSYNSVRCLFQDSKGFIWIGTDGGGNLDAAPLLGALSDNGGTTQTMLPGTGSSAVDAGDGCESTDQRGIARPQGIACDIGAVEVVVDRSSAGACRVDASKPAPGDGLSWASAYPDLQSALHDHSCSEVWVAAGTYTPVTAATSTPTTAERKISFNIRPEVQVYGGFAGTETQRSERDSGANSTILSGDLIGDDGANFANNIDNSNHVVFMDGTQGTPITPSTVLDGFTISGGNANNSRPNDAGGGLYCHGPGNGHECSPNVSNVTFSSNSALLGGAMFNQAMGFSTTTTGGISSPVLNNVTFSGNSATNDGGAMFNNGRASSISSPTLSNVTFSGNSAGEDGGAMYNASNDGTSSPSLSNVTFSGNSADRGGAMYNDISSPILSNVISWGNTATSGPEIYNDSATPSIDHSVIQDSGGSGNWDTDLGTDGGGNLDTDPLLGALADNGGFTHTMLPGTGSSAIDVGNATTCTNPSVNGLDQRGITRPQGVACDIGAVEVEQYILSVSVTGSGNVSAAASPTPVSGGIGTCSATGGANCAAFYTSNANVTLSASADTGQHFVSWSGDCASDGTVTMDADKTCQAEFAINTHGVGGTVSGLAGSGLVLQVNGGDNLPITGDGSFTFATPLDYGTNYSVTVLSQPTDPAQTCSVSNASASMPDVDINDVMVNCATNTHTVTATVGSGNDSGNITPTSQSVEDGGTASFTVTADAGWYIDSVSGCGGTLSGNSYTTGPITGPCTITVTFAPYVAVPTLDWRMLLLLASLLSGIAAVRLRRA